MDTKDPIEEHAKLILDAYSYALEHKLDIKSKTDVVTILKAVNPEHSSEENAEDLIPVLQIADEMVKSDLAKRKKSVIN